MKKPGGREKIKMKKTAGCLGFKINIYIQPVIFNTPP
jgi:hypothetical protein